MTAADVKFSLERALAPSTGSQLIYYDQLIQGYQAYTTSKAKHLSGVTVIDPHTVQIKISKPVAYFLTAFTDDVNNVLDPAVVASKNATDTNNYLTNICEANKGAGPYMFVCLNNSSSVTSFYPAGRTPSYTLVPNPYYYGPKAHLKIVLPAVGNPETAYNEYLAGQLQMVDIPPDHVDQWRAKPAGQYHTATTSANYWLNLFNCGVGNNIFGWCDPAFDKITAQADGTFDQNTRYALYARAQHIVLSQAPVVPEYISLLVYLLKPGIHGLTRTSAYYDIMPQNLDWSQVTISAH